MVVLKTTRWLYLDVLKCIGAGNCDIGILQCQRKYDDDDDEVDDDYDDDVVVVKAVSGIYASWQRLWVRGCTGRPTLDWFGSTTFGILFIIIISIIIFWQTLHHHPKYKQCKQFEQ